MVLPADVGAGRADLRALAAELARPVPPIAVGLFGSLGPDGVPASHLAAGISGSYGVDADRAAQLPVSGTPAAAAERLAAYCAAGADHLVVGLAGANWRHQVDLLAEARSLLG